jgi:hypothetical protein
MRTAQGLRQSASRNTLSSGSKPKYQRSHTCTHSLCKDNGKARTAQTAQHPLGGRLTPRLTPRAVQRDESRTRCSMDFVLSVEIGKLSSNSNKYHSSRTAHHRHSTLHTRRPFYSRHNQGSAGEDSALLNNQAPQSRTRSSTIWSLRALRLKLVSSSLPSRHVFLASLPLAAAEWGFASLSGPQLFLGNRHAEAGSEWWACSRRSSARHV